MKKLLGMSLLLVLLHICASLSMEGQGVAKVENSNLFALVIVCHNQNQTTIFQAESFNQMLPNGDTPLSMACKYYLQSTSCEEKRRVLGIIKKLLIGGANWQEANAEDRTPQEIAYHDSDLDLCAVLMVHAGEISGESIKPFYEFDERSKVIILICDDLGNGISDDINLKTRGQTLLTIACHNDSHEWVDYLLQFGADPNIKNVHKETPLDIALANNNEALINRLLMKTKSVDHVGSITWSKKNGHIIMPQNEPFIQPKPHEVGNTLHAALVACSKDTPNHTKNYCCYDKSCNKKFNTMIELACHMTMARDADDQGHGWVCCDFKDCWYLKPKRDKHHLIEHKKTVHTVPCEHKCTLLLDNRRCGASYNNRNSLIYHRKRVHPEEFSKSIWSVSTNQATDLDESTEKRKNVPLSEKKQLQQHSSHKKQHIEK